MPEQTTTTGKGLEGVVVAQTQLSKVQGDIGKLQYHGYNIQDLAENATFEEVIYLLWNLKLPTKTELETLHKEIVSYQKTPKRYSTHARLPRDANPMAVLRTAVSELALFDPESEDNSPEANRRKAARLVAAIPIFIAAWERIRSGKDPVNPRNDLSIAANFLYMMTGQVPTDTQVKSLDTYLVLLADHGMNASTFSARVTTSTLADMYSAITSAIGTLKGSAHGGANQKAMEQFMSIGGPDKVDAWFEESMRSGRRIMGIGHRVYKAVDPRAQVLWAQAQALADEAGGEVRDWFEVANRLEQCARAHEYFIERNLYANVDYYSAISLYQVGIPVDQFTPVFAMSRIAGWSAHVMEQWADNRLIRPRGEYLGPVDQPWIPMEQRK